LSIDLILEPKIKTIKWFLEWISLSPTNFYDQATTDLTYSYSANIIIKSTKSYFLFRWFLFHSRSYIHCILLIIPYYSSMILFRSYLQEKRVYSYPILKVPKQENLISWTDRFDIREINLTWANVAKREVQYIFVTLPSTRLTYLLDDKVSKAVCLHKC
jgi:hypothetical protein